MAAIGGREFVNAMATMNSEVKQAFAHPAMRSIATASDEFLDRISVRNHVIDVEIGAFQVERGITQRISFDVVVEVKPSSGAMSDDVDDILSYDRVTEAIEAEVHSERLNLLETLAERVAARLLKEPQPVRVFVRIEKLDRGASKLGVEIVRSKGDSVDVVANDQQPEATVIHIGNEALTSEYLATWLDQIVDLKIPVILTMPNGAQSLTDATSVARRRIELLEIEQLAWKLAEQDRRCVVVDSWTELDWGLKHDQLSVWAPSKTVFDSSEDSISSEFDGRVLSQWLATQLSPSKHLILDASRRKLSWVDAE